MEYNHGQHSTYMLTYHFVFVVKYRRPVFDDEIDNVIRSAAASVSACFEGELLSYESDKDHIHMLVSLPPNICVSTFVRSVKTQTSRAVRSEYPDKLKAVLWDDRFWTDSFFVASTGTVSMDAVKAYIENQKTDTHKRKYNKKKQDYWDGRRTTGRKQAD